MSVPSSRVTFKEYCLRKLGKPVIQINVDDDQVDDRIDEALNRFYERNYQGSEEVFITYDITTPTAIVDSNGEYVLDSNGEKTYTTNTDTEKGYIQLPDEMIGVTNVFRPQFSAGTTPTEQQILVNQMFNTLSPSLTGLDYYFMYRNQQELISRLLIPERQYDYNPISNKLIIAGGLKDSDLRFGGVIIRGFRRLYGEGDSNTTIYNIWQNRWLQQYATALIKQQWAENLSKYQEVALIGGVRMNGETIWTRAEQEIERLERQLIEEYELPPAPIVG